MSLFEARSEKLGVVQAASFLSEATASIVYLFLQYSAQRGLTSFISVAKHFAHVTDVRGLPDHRNANSWTITSQEWAAEAAECEYSVMLKVLRGSLAGEVARKALVA